MKRYLESLFSHKLLFLLPVIIIPLVVVVGGLFLATNYLVEARIWVEEQPFLDPSNSLGLSRMANQVEAERLQEWLTTKTFRSLILEKSGMTEAVQNGEWPKLGGLHAMADWPLVGPILRGTKLVGPVTGDVLLAEAYRYLERTLAVEAQGSNIIIVSYRGDEPELGVRFIEAVIAVYIDKSSQSMDDRTSLALVVYEEQVQLQATRLANAAWALQSFLETHPVGFMDEARPPAEEVQLAELERAYDLESTLYDTALNRLEQARIAAKAVSLTEDIGFEVVDPPEVPNSGVITRRSIVMMIVGGLGGGLGMGIILIAIVNWNDTSIRNNKDLELVFNSPTVATIPDLERRSSRSKLQSTLPELNEVRRRLYHRLLGDSNAPETRVLAVSGLMNGDGGTTNSIGLAITMAHDLDKKILLVDCNMSQPTIHNRFNLSASPGLAEYLSYQCQLNNALKKTDIRNLWLLPAGDWAGNSSKLVLTSAIKTLPHTITKVFDFAILDLPPLMESSDTEIIAPLTDGLVLVVRAGVTSLEILNEAVNLVGEDNIKGVIINRDNSAIPRWLQRFL